MCHRNIYKHGYPPPHCDADGDFREEEDGEELAGLWRLSPK